MSNETKITKEQMGKELLAELIYETIGGKYGVTDVMDYDQILGYYETYDEAKTVCLERIKQKENKRR